MIKLPRCFFCGLFFPLVLSTSAAAHKTENIFFISVDGFRWQEVFGGAEALLMNKENGGVDDTNRLQAQFLRPTAEERRRVLLPFFWDVISKHGQLYGNQDKGSAAVLTNGKKFTYPGFNEMFTGYADERIDKNEKRNNPNVTVLEWLHRKPAFAQRVVGFANWDVHPYVLNSQRSGIPVWTGYDTNLPATPGSRLELVQQIHRDTTPYWPDMSYDSFYLHAALEYLKEKKPRILWLALSETDEWAHEGRYDLYLYAAHGMDACARDLWMLAQALPDYRDKTTIILTCDHGRGGGPKEWRNHGASVAGAENIWLAVIGPDTPPLGERTNAPPIRQSQIAATLAALLGEDYHGAVPKSAPAIGEVLPASSISR